MKVLVLIFTLFCSVAFAQGKTKNETYTNFTISERLGTWALNNFTLNSGLGSFIIMEDYVGGGVLLGSTAIAGIGFLIASKGGLFDPDFNTGINIAAFGVTFGLIWNIYRSATYDKPHYYALIDPRNLRLSAMPSQDGKSLMPGVFYNVRF